MLDISDRYTTRHKFIIDIKNFKIIEKLNSGGFGSIYSVKDTRNHNIYAAKVLLSKISDEESKKMINREIGIMMRLQHPTIVQFHGYSLTDFDGQNNVTIIMSLAKNGSLASVIQNVQKGLAHHQYDNTMRQKILIGVARGMMHLHQNHIIHRDLKPGNILIDEYFNPHITDFGLSKFCDVSCSQNQTQSYGTSIYMAPEVICENKYSGKADVYSFAILMYEVVTDCVPYPLFQSGKMTQYQFNEKVLRQNYRPEFTSPVKESIKELIIKCWSPEPRDRPTFEEIFNKLAFNLEESVYDVFEGDEEFKYHLEDVDVDSILTYAHDINSANITKDSNLNQNELLEKLNRENQKLKDENLLLKNDIKQLKNDNQKIDMRVKVLEDLVNKLLNENQSGHLKSIESPIIVQKQLNTNKTFLYNPNHEFNGIIKYLYDISKGDIKNEIDITSSSYSGGSVPQNVVMYDKKNRFCSTGNDAQPWICFDFRDKRVILSHYTIRVSDYSHPRSWIVGGSNDYFCWAAIDKQVQCQALNGDFRVHTFPVSCSQQYKYIRIMQTDRSWSRSDLFIIDSFEIYGDLLVN